MYRQRLYIFISICILTISVCVARLSYLQIYRKDITRELIRASRILKPQQLPTVRGGIYDRNGNALAVDRPKFFLQINYELTRFLDDRFWQASVNSRINDKTTAEQAQQQMEDEYSEDIEKLFVTIDKCSEILGVSEAELKLRTHKVNNWIWNLREVVAWRNKFPESQLLLKHKAAKIAVRYENAMPDFENLLSQTGAADPLATRYKLALNEDLAEMHQFHPIYEIKTDEQLLDVQLAFIGLSGVKISPECDRVYQYGSSACHLIGWVGPARLDLENKLFPDDIYSRYIAKDFSGKDGIEKVCEVILRGKRGEVTYNKDDELLARKETLFGQDINLTIDIELQQRIESYLTNLNLHPDPNAQIGAVAMDVASGDILAMVSIPTFDINQARKKYNELLAMPTAPLKNKALYETFPPGSVIKPVILAMGLEEEKVTASERISCPAHSAPNTWPNCIIFRKFYSSHDDKWAYEGGNTARNAIKGSCNIYFSHLADRLPPIVLQQWLFKFGFGHMILPAPQYPDLLDELKRTEGTGMHLLESNGQISTTTPQKGRIKHILQLGTIKDYEKRLFGIGQGSMRVTVLQVANSIAAIARGGIYKAPRLFLDDQENADQIDLGLSDNTLDVIRGGMSAVVNEEGGTAHSAFRECQLDQREIKIFGKTGSTENPENAWFAGFAEDITGRSVAIAIVVKRGQSGAKDAAPKGRRIFELCNEAGYIGVARRLVSSQ